MADYWVSQPKHYCKYCKIWIHDNKIAIKVCVNSFGYNTRLPGRGPAVPCVVAAGLNPPRPHHTTPHHTHSNTRGA